MFTKGISPEPSEYIDSGFNQSDFSEPEPHSDRLNQIPNFESNEDAFFLLPGSHSSAKPVPVAIETPSEIATPRFHTQVSKEADTSKLTRHKAYAI